MDSDWIPIISVGLGAVLGAWLTGLGEARRWRRQWTSDFFHDRVNYVGEVINAADAVVTVMGQFALARTGQRTPVPPERIISSDDEWRRLFAVRALKTSVAGQNAMVAFDKAKGAAAEAVNTGVDIDARLEALNARREELIDALVTSARTLTPAMARHLLPPHVRLWRRVRGKSMDYL